MIKISCGHTLSVLRWVWRLCFTLYVAFTGFVMFYSDGKFVGWGIGMLVVGGIMGYYIRTTFINFQCEIQKKDKKDLVIGD